MFSNLRSKYLVPLAGALSVLAASSAWAVNPASSTTTLGETLEVQIDAPLDGATVPAGPVNVVGRTGLPIAVGNIAVTYIVDFSGSTGTSVGDCNGDGVVNELDDVDSSSANGSVLDCELIGVAALNNSLAAVPGISVGLVAFDDSASVRDVDPLAAGTQQFTTPAADADGNGVRDIPQAGKLLAPSGGTDFDVALTAMNAAFATRPAGEQHVAFFLSDGVGSLRTSGTGTPLAAAAAAGTRIFTYSVGPGATGCGVGAGLRTIADVTGGTCTEVINPAALTSMLTGTTPNGIAKVEVSVDGGPAVPTSLDALGNFAASVNLSAGVHQIFAKTFANDGTTATADIQINAGTGTSDADLFISKTATKPSVATGETITYTIGVLNQGPGAATGVVVTDNLPPNTGFVSAAATQGGCAFAAPTVTCNLGTLANGGVAFITLNVLTQQDGTVVNTASVSGNEPDPNPGNSSSSVSVAVGKRVTLTPKPVVLSALVGSLLQIQLKFEARLADGNNGVPGKPIVFTAGGQTCTGTTNAKGVATCKLTLRRLIASVLRLGYVASFAGDSTLPPISARGPIVQILGIKVL
ncbi:MAG: hypothetical protein ACT4PZ_24640 [Panacagrimonas sp.]